MSDTNVVAIACVVDSSYILASEWSRILVEYISPLLKRLSETYAGYHFRVAVVIYATSDMRPSPLLSKRFFAPIMPVTKELKDDPAKLGFGQTANGGRRGMAALEGFVAAMELFDILRTSIEAKSGKPLSVNRSPPKNSSSSPQQICHVFHVAASPADNAQRPMWNDSPGLDGVTWESLPGEFKKRNINLSMINLRQLPRFAELHSFVAAGGAQQPWFNVRSPNTILLAGFPSPQQKPANLAAILKRPGDAHIVERTPDAKRPKLQPSPSPQSKNATSPSQTHNQTQPPTIQSNLTPSQLAQPPPPRLMVMPQVATQQHILEFLRVAEIHLQHMDIAINNATAAGNTHLAESLKKEKSTKLLNHQKYKAVLASMAQSQQLALSRSVTQETEGEGGTSAMPNSSASSNHPSSSPSNKDLNPAPLGSENNGIANSVVPGHDPQALSQLAQSRMAISTFPPLPNTNPNPPLASVPPPGLQVPPSVSPQLAAQMQKLFDQQRNRPPHLGGPPLPHQQGLTHSEQQQSSSNMSAAGDHLRTTPVWQGLLTWTGFDAATQGRKEVHAQVAAYLQTSSNTDSRSETWPATITLMPARDPAVSMPELQIWMKRHKPVLCAFQAQARSVDPKSNEAYYRALAQLLMAKGIFAVASWTLPSGNHDNNMLVFPVNGLGLGAAIFPLTGIPELPKPITFPLVNLSPAFAAQLQRLNPEQKTIIMAQLLRQQQQQSQQQQQRQQQQQQQQQQESSNLGGGSTLQFNVGGSQASSSYPGVLASQQPGTGTNLQQGMASSGLQRSLSGNMQSGGTGSVTNEILQSFMQRNAKS